MAAQLQLHMVFSVCVFMTRFPLFRRTPVILDESPSSWPRFNVITSEVLEVRTPTHAFEERT